MGSVSTSLGEWIHSPWLIWDSWCGKGTAQGAPGACGGAMLLRGFRLFGVALHQKPLTLLLRRKINHLLPLPWS